MENEYDILMKNIFEIFYSSYFKNKTVGLCSLSVIQNDNVKLRNEGR